MTQDHTQEELKQVLVRDRNSGFYTRAPRTFGATYRVLFCSLRGRQRSCKVDILIPGILEIPQISPRRFAHVGGLPLIPIITLLILKLKGWDDHRQSGRSDFRLKQYVDIRDINQLLAIVVEAGANLNSDRVYLPSEFVQQAEERLTKFIQAVRNTTRTSHWKQIGFSVPDELWLWVFS